MINVEYGESDKIQLSQNSFPYHITNGVPHVGTPFSCLQSICTREKMGKIVQTSGNVGRQCRQPFFFVSLSL